MYYEPNIHLTFLYQEIQAKIESSPVSLNSFEIPFLFHFRPHFHNGSGSTHYNDEL